MRPSLVRSSPLCDLGAVPAARRSASTHEGDPSYPNATPPRAPPSSTSRSAWKYWPSACGEGLAVALRRLAVVVVDRDQRGGRDGRCRHAPAPSRGRQPARGEPAREPGGGRGGLCSPERARRRVTRSPPGVPRILGASISSSSATSESSSTSAGTRAFNRCRSASARSSGVGDPEGKLGREIACNASQLILGLQ